MGNERFDFDDYFEKEWDKYREKHKLLPNIMILGRTGVGKSSLINRIFNTQIAPVSATTPKTQEFDYYGGKEYNLAVNLIDSKGYEINDDGQTSENSKHSFIEKVNNEISWRAKKEDSRIHIIWYCISVSEHRVEPIDTELITTLSNLQETKGRVAVILTKCDQDDSKGSRAAEMKKAIKKNARFLDSSIFEVSTDPNYPLELNKMVSWSIEALDDEDLKDNFIASQYINLDEKKNRAKKYINTAVMAAAAIAFSPIPFSDAALLVPTQLTMITGIINTYGIQSLATISEGVVGNIIISTMGKSLASNLIKMFPGLGTLFGGMVNAVVATSITKAIGDVCSRICYKACEDIMKGKKVDFASLFIFENMSEMVAEFLKGRKNDA